MSACRSCGAQIIWARTERGKAMPVDAQSTPDGNLVLTEEPTGELIARVDARPMRQRYTSHFQTCPNADSHRRPRGAAR